MAQTVFQFFEGINNFKDNFFTLKFFEYYQIGFDPESALFLLNWLILLFLIFMIGASFCGFFQCMIYRKDQKINLLIARSFCDVCGKTLEWIDPVPFINYLVLGGKCRYCKTQLPLKYFLSETLSGIIMLVLMFSPLHILFILPFAIFMIFVTAYVFYFDRLNLINIGLMAVFITIFKWIYGFGGLDFFVSAGLILLMGVLVFLVKKPEFNLQYLLFLSLLSLAFQPADVVFGIILGVIFTLVFILGRKLYHRRNPDEAMMKTNTIYFTGLYFGLLVCFTLLQR